MNVIQIDVTNMCNKSCSNCTRFCGHFIPENIYFMDLKYYEMALKSLKDFPSIVGMIGGEPTLHPNFFEFCELVKFYIPEKNRRGLWTNTLTEVYNKNKGYIFDVFGVICMNDHKAPIYHTPILTSIEDLDNLSVEEKNNFINNCWIQLTWSATITPKGGYFCEVAGMLSMLFNGPEGRNVEADPEWWKKDISIFSDQIDWACNKCGCSIPLIPRRCVDEIDDVSETNLKRLEEIKSPKIKLDKYVLSKKEIKLGQNRKCDWYRNYK
jgi:hypothetical protein